ncbi:uncharacterized protein EAF01_005122 [Botrytis porri]|uniref:Uncharacterized protein n=1 Tax=Botrytis porri TaxID=87229 RepID=A0A4Z1L7A0_9HELO|nr:uncharacterized protein EAF01_005122 [Botrytis porri]KAF7907536.1 hypothetical protein EAF01_005122 [Botrytis porri]TGO92513.1 hypothetical protein BPOR_0002g00600 [Botrytis porri]
MSKYHAINYASLPAITSPRSPPKYQLSNPGYSTQMAPPYGQPNPPPSNHLALNDEVRNGSYCSNKPRDNIFYIVFNLCGESRCLELEASEHRPRRKYTLEKSLCNNYDECARCRTVKFQSEKLKRAIDRERFHEILNTQLSKLWIGKGMLFEDGFSDSDNNPPLFDTRRIMRVILGVRSIVLENETE